MSRTPLEIRFCGGSEAFAAARILDWSKHPHYYRCISQAALQRFDDRRKAALQAVNVIVGALLNEGDTALTTS